MSATIDTEVTYTPSPRRMGKKKVKLNPLKRPSNEGRRGPKLTQEANYGQGYDKTLQVVPIGKDPFGSNVAVIGGTSVKM